MIKSFSHGARGALQRAAPFAAALALAACTTAGSPVGSATSATAAPPAGALAALRREDVVWLQRLTFGLDSRTVGDYRRLGRGLTVLAQSLGAEWKNTVVVVLSEFGRTFRENGNRGTDHGHGTVYWVLGGSVNGGRIAGAQRALARGTLFQDRDYPVLNDYRAVLGGLFRSLWTLTPAQCAQIFPQITPVDLQLV